MLYAIIILFASAAIAGLILANAIFRKKETPKPVVFIHGGLAASALVLLVYYALNNPGSLWATVIVFLVAATGGFYLLYRDLTKKPGPITMVVVHAVAAVTGFILLLIIAFG